MTQVTQLDQILQIHLQQVKFYKGIYKLFNHFGFKTQIQLQNPQLEIQ